MNTEQWGLAAAGGAIALLVGLLVTNASKFRDNSPAAIAMLVAVICFGLCALASLVNQFWSGGLTGFFELSKETDDAGRILLIFPGQDWPLWFVSGCAAALMALAMLVLSSRRR